MRKLLLITVLFTALVGLSLAGCQSSAKRCGGACDGRGCGSGACPIKATTPGCKACAKGKAGEAAWCDSCKVGYVDAKKVACRGCFLAKTGGPACAACAAKSN